MDGYTGRSSAVAAGLGGLLGALALLVASAERAAAYDLEPYRKLLAAHVRPGSVAGLRLNLVDYKSLRADPNYAQALREVAGAELAKLATENERFAFWVNAYNLMAIKAVVDQYPVASIKDGGSLLRPIWKKTVGKVAGRDMALDDIEHGILRKQFKEPRVHLAVVCASLSCPDLRAEPYEAAKLEGQLDDQAAKFLANTTKGMVVGGDGKTAQVSSIFKWFRDDFAPAGGVAAFLKAKADAQTAARIAGLTDDGLSYLSYDWSLNDTARAR